MFGLALAGTLTAARTASGQAVVAAAGDFLEYYAGVFTLVTLTGAVVFGVVAALRVLPPRPRIVAQALHRASAVTAVGFLVTHAVLKVMEAHARPLDLVVPTTPSWVALGTIAGDLLVLAAATGAARGRYAATVRPWAWRMLHCTVYVTWPVALAHGLLAGRAPKAWVTISYLVCAAAVVGLLLIRSATTTRREPPGTAPAPDLADLAGAPQPPRTAEPVERPAPPAPPPPADPFAARIPTDPFTPRATAPRTDPFAAAFADGPRPHATFGTYTPPGGYPPPRVDATPGPRPAPGFAEPPAATGPEFGAPGPAETPGAGFPRAPEGVAKTRTAPPEDAGAPVRGSEPDRARRKGKKGRHQVQSIDDQDAAFWASLRAERRDWTRPS